MFCPIDPLKISSVVAEHVISKAQITCGENVVCKFIR